MYKNRANQPIPIPPPPRTPAHIIYALFLSVLSTPCLDVLIHASPISLCPELVETAYFAFCTYFRNMSIPHRHPWVVEAPSSVPIMVATQYG